MSKSFLIAGFCVAAAVASCGQADEDDLFSSVRTESVFTPSSDGAASAVTRRTQRVAELQVKISSTGELARKMRLAGLEVEEDSENRMVSTKTTLGQWKFPVLVVIAPDDSQLMLAMLLSSATSEEQIPKSKLLELLQANRKYAPASFGYSAKRKRTELYHIVKNQQISGQKLRDEIERLAKVAVETQSLWDFGTKSQPKTSTQPNTQPQTSTPPQAQPNTQPQTSTPPQAAPSLAGKWVATRSAKEAFAIQFNADRTFLLVYVKNGQQTKSTGKFTRQGSKLALEGNGGFRLTGTVNSQTDKEFQFQLASATAGAKLIFKRAN